LLNDQIGYCINNKDIYINFDSKRRTLDDNLSYEKGEDGENKTDENEKNIKTEYGSFYFEPNSYLLAQPDSINFVPDKFYIQNWNGKWIWVNTNLGEINPNLEYYLMHDDYDTTYYFNMAARYNKYPLSLGFQEKIENRNFKVDWYGNLYTTGGIYSGTFKNGLI
jgi:hypothetical protein